MVVGIDELVLALFVAQLLQRKIGDHLVGVHVGRSASAALDEVGDELVAHLTGDQAVTSGGNGIGDAASSTPRSRLANAAAFLT